MKITAIVGSNRKKSANRQLLQYMQKHFKDQNIQLMEIKDVPMFNENHSAENPQIIKDMAQQIETSDAVIISTPEYNHSVPSALKSVIEWLSYRIHPLKGKPVMIVGVSTHPQGSSRSQQHLRQILDSPGVNATVFYCDEFLLGNGALAFDDQSNLKDEKTVDFLTHNFEEFLKFVKSQPKPMTHSTKEA